MPFDCDLCVHYPELWIPLFAHSGERLWCGECRKGHRVTKMQPPGSKPVFVIDRPWTGKTECGDFESLVPF